MLAEDFEFDIDLESSNNTNSFAEINKKLLRKNFHKKTKFVNKKPLSENDESVNVSKQMNNVTNDLSHLFCDNPLDFVIEKRETKVISTIFPMSVRRKIDEEWLINSEKAIHATDGNDNLIKKQLSSDNLQNETENIEKVDKTVVKHKPERVRRLKRTNFILLNLKRKTYVRGQKKMTFKKYKFNMWKLRKSQARAEVNNE